jgi:cellulose synthase (UDP-forming)
VSAGRDERRRERRRATCLRDYASCAALTGEPEEPDDAPRVRLRRLLSRDDRAVLTALSLAGVVTSLAFLVWLALPAHVPTSADDPGMAGWRLAAARTAFGLMIAVELVRIAQNACVHAFAWWAADPVALPAPRGLRIALLTTIVPSREPLEIAARCLRALRAVEYADGVDVWILDEEDDDAVRALAADLGVRHFTRRHDPELNTADGPYRARTKAGNHNAWRARHEAGYDVVGIFDPDHVARPEFLHRTLGYFRDADIAFVVTPQIYANMYDSFLTHGAAGQQWLFNGIMQRAGNGLLAPMLTGTNNLYRTSALRQVGGFRSSVVEVHLTSIHVHASVNPATGRHWRSVYTPDVLALGEGPATWTDYFSQQQRWAYGNSEIVTRRQLWPDGTLPWRQRLFYGLLQFYYPSVAAAWVMGNLSIGTYLLIGSMGSGFDPTAWLVLWTASVVSCFSLLAWLRRFYLAPLERREWGMPCYLLSVIAAPVYTAAALAALARRPLGFTVTPKGRLRSSDSVWTFRLNLGWALGMGLVAAAGVVLGNGDAAGLWALVAPVAGFAPLVVAGLSALAHQQRHGQPGRGPGLLDDVAGLQGAVEPRTQVVEGVRVLARAHEPDPRRLPEAALDVRALDRELPAGLTLRVDEQDVGRPA